MKYFGTDGVRGKSFIKLNALLAYKIGMSLKEVYNPEYIVIGLDTRDSSPMLAHMVASGALSAGIDVLYAGVVSTPMIAHYSKLKQTIGIMITASHNPYTDNGIKVFNKGFKSQEQEELIMESYIDGKVYYSEKFGNFNLSDDILNEYLKLIDSLNIPKSNLKVLYDSANGANYQISQLLFNKYFINSKQINNEPNGKNINLNCGSTYLETLKNEMKKFHYDLGVSYDGDGDRLLVVGSDLITYDGDMIIYLLAKYLKDKNELNNNKVVLTKMSNPGILKALKRASIDYVLTDVGDKYVFEAMINEDLVLGGEASGHIIMRKLLDSGDGLLTSLYILKILEEYKLDLKEVFKDVSLYPLKMINIKDINKDVLKEEHVINYLDNYKRTLDDEDLLLVRASGTEDLVRVTLSVNDKDKLDKDISKIVDYIKKAGINLWKNIL